jgi:hypothetical protein
MTTNLSNHPLHKNIGDSLTKISRTFTVILDEACGGEQRIPLFAGQKGRETGFCNVDAMILKDRKVKVIIEIEQSDTRPTRICGKYLTSALTIRYDHQNDDAIDLDKQSILFVQVVDASGFSKKKAAQCANIERAINALNDGGCIKEYKLFCSENEQTPDGFIEAIEEFLANNSLTI